MFAHSPSACFPDESVGAAKDSVGSAESNVTDCERKLLDKRTEVQNLGQKLSQEEREEVETTRGRGERTSKATEKACRGWRKVEEHMPRDDEDLGQESSVEQRDPSCLHVGALYCSAQRNRRHVHISGTEEAEADHLTVKTYRLCWHVAETGRDLCKDAGKHVGNFGGREMGKGERREVERREGEGRKSGDGEGRWRVAGEGEEEREGEGLRERYLIERERSVRYGRQCLGEIRHYVSNFLDCTREY